MSSADAEMQRMPKEVRAQPIKMHAQTIEVTFASKCISLKGGKKKCARVRTCVWGGVGAMLAVRGSQYSVRAHGFNLEPPSS